MSQPIPYTHSNVGENDVLTCNYLIRHDVCGVSINLYPRTDAVDSALFDYGCALRDMMSEDKDGEAMRVMSLVHELKYNILSDDLLYFATYGSDAEYRNDVLGELVKKYPFPAKSSVETLRKCGATECPEYLVKCIEAWKYVSVDFCVHNGHKRQFVENKLIDKAFGTNGAGNIDITEVCIRVRDYLPDDYVDVLNYLFICDGSLPNNVMVPSHLISFNNIAEFYQFMYLNSEKIGTERTAEMLNFFSPLDEAELTNARLLLVLGHVPYGEGDRTVSIRRML